MGCPEHRWEHTGQCALGVLRRESLLSFLLYVYHACLATPSSTREAQFPVSYYLGQLKRYKQSPSIGKVLPRHGAETFNQLSANAVRHLQHVLPRPERGEPAAPNHPQPLRKGWDRTA